MREIKFRGKNEDNKWVYGTGIVQVEINTYDTDKWELIQKVNYDELDYFQPSYETEHIDIKTLGQYTGLKDKNGVEIYEGDIIKAKFFNKEIVGYIGFSMGCFMIAGSGVSDNQIFVFNDIEVIGNIYDNPKLLENE